LQDTVDDRRAYERPARHDVVSGVSGLKRLQWKS
jgi:hypothetical protein